MTELEDDSDDDADEPMKTPGQYVPEVVRDGDLIVYRKHLDGVR